MTNTNNKSKNIPVSILLVAVAATPLLLSSCGGLSRSDRETVDIPTAAVGTAATEPTPTAATAPTEVAKPIVKTPAAPPYSLSDAVKYIVESGDSLSVIAAKHGVSMGDVMKANKIANANKIRIGQTLLLPAKEEESAEATAAEVTPPTPAESTTPVITAEDTSPGIDTSGLKLPSLSGE